MRVLIILAVVLLVFGAFNWLTVRQLLRIHPRRKRWIVAAAVIGNLMWLFLPLLRSGGWFIRVVRSVLAPPWVAWTLFAILYAAVIFLVLLAWIPFARRLRFAEFARWPSRVLLTIVILALALGYYDALVPLHIERVTIRVPNLPPAAEGTRVALLSDLHVGLFTRPSRLTEIFTTTRELRPDVVLLAGDLIDDDPYYVPKLLDGTRALAPDTPLLGALGNHEMYGNPDSVVRQMRGSRIRLLINEGFPLRDLWFAGLADPAGRDFPERKDYHPDYDKALQAKPPASLPIIFAHQPKVVDEARRRGLPVVLAAHTHGGQGGCRSLGWSLAHLVFPYPMGLYDLAPTQLYVSTGTGYWVLPFRLGMEPEITLIELAAAGPPRTSPRP